MPISSFTARTILLYTAYEASGFFYCQLLLANYKIKNTKRTNFEIWIFFIILWKYRKFLTHWYIFRLEKIITWLRKLIFKNENFKFWEQHKIFLRMIFRNFFCSCSSSGLDELSELKKFRIIIRYVVVITITKMGVFEKSFFFIFHFLEHIPVFLFFFW